MKEFEPRYLGCYRMIAGNVIRTMKAYVISVVACGLASGCAAFKPPEDSGYDRMKATDAYKKRPQFHFP